MVELDWMDALRLATAVFAMTGVIVILRRQIWTPATVYWAAAATGMFCFSIDNAAGAALGPVGIIVALGCAATCGWYWLFARALFRRGTDFEIGPLSFVLILYGSASLGDLGERYLGIPAASLHVVDNLTRMLSSVVLLLPIYEALRDYGPGLAKPERRMRQGFLVVYGGLIAVTGLWLRGASEGSLAAQFEAPILSIAPLIALTLSSAALVFRLNHPLPASAGKPQRRKPAPADPEAEALAARVVARLAANDYFTTPNLRVADIAAALGEPDYLVSKAVAAATGHANFNRLVNHFRIEKAKALLRDPAHAGQQVLTIALDCGFGSIGPFNRAFKETTGVTPREYRRGAQVTPARRVEPIRARA